MGLLDQVEAVRLYDDEDSVEAMVPATVLGMAGL